MGGSDSATKLVLIAVLLLLAVPALARVDPGEKETIILEDVVIMEESPKLMIGAEHSNTTAALAKPLKCRTWGQECHAFDAPCCMGIVCVYEECE